jgi:hypothetical protein
MLGGKRLSSEEIKQKKEAEARKAKKAGYERQVMKSLLHRRVSECMVCKPVIKIGLLIRECEGFKRVFRGFMSLL